MLTILSENCIQCSLCSLICPTGAIGKGSVDNSRCILCGECQVNCPETAIRNEN